MSFSYSPDLDDALSRVRFDLGATTDAVDLPDETVEAVLTRHTSGTPAVVDEAAATRDLARGLAARYAAEPDAIGENGATISWRSRVAHWTRIALGQQGGATHAPAAAASVARGIIITRGPARDYTTGAGDAS